MELRNDRREVVWAALQAGAIAISICIGMIRITFEQHAGA